MKQIRVFTNSNHFGLATEVNNFIKNNKVKINDIQYSTSGGILSGTEYSVMIVIEEEEN